MKTATVCIGNTDNKLTQQEWAEFVERVEKAVHLANGSVQFFGGCSAWARYQNCCWVATLGSNDVSALRGMLAIASKEFRQDSIALVIGETDFVRPAA